jgi:hypothetical protein
MVVGAVGDVCGLTNEGLRVWKTKEKGIYRIEGRMWSQYWYRSYAECHTWVRFFKIKTRAEHKEELLVQR